MFLLADVIEDMLCKIVYLSTRSHISEEENAQLLRKV